MSASQLSQPSLGRKRIANHHHPISISATTTTTNSVRWHASVFSGGWDGKEWHDKDFLVDATIKEKEAWLQSILKSRPKDVDVQAFLIVLQALATPDIDDAGAPRRAEHWMAQLKKHRSLHPTPECYQAAIRAWANSNKENILVVVNRKVSKIAT